MMKREDAYFRLTPGNSAEEVIGMIGRPDRIDRIFGGERWTYIDWNLEIVFQGDSELQVTDVIRRSQGVPRS